MVVLEEFGGGFERARAINEAGQVSGEGLLPGVDVVRRGLLWQAGEISDLGSLGGPQSSALAINNAGTVGGWAQTASGSTLPAIWNGNGVTELSTLGGASGTVWGLNDAGAAVGLSYLATGDYHATFWSGSGVLDLGTLGGSYSIAYDVNNVGAVVGTASDSLNRDRAALWQEGNLIDLGGLSGGQWTAARAINDLGQMILWGTPFGETRNQAVFWDGNLGSSVVDLGTFGGGESWAFGLNDLGFVVGWAEKESGYYHAFVWNGEEKTDLGTLGGYYSSAYGINNQGAIAGHATDEFGLTHAVVWVPVPEPETFLLGLLGGGMVALWSRCRKSSRPV